jgi:hypothetical protein
VEIGWKLSEKNISFTNLGWGVGWAGEVELGLGLSLAISVDKSIISVGTISNN